MGWLKQALTGEDNQTVAIGRLLGMAIAVVLLIGLPVTAAATVITGAVKVETWATFMGTLDLYVPAITLAIGGLIWGTNGTEPRSRQSDNGSDNHG